MTDTESATRSDRNEGDDSTGATDSADNSGTTGGDESATIEEPTPLESATPPENATSLEESSSSSAGASADEDGPVSDSRVRRYLVGGVLTALLSVLILPIAGLVSVYCGYKLLRVDRRPTWLSVSSYAFVGVGLFSLVSWVLYLLSL